MDGVCPLLCSMDIVKTWKEFLDGHEWDYFSTFTTRYPITLKSARRLMEKVGKHSCLTKDSMMFWVAEHFEVRDGYHTHALMKTPLDASSIWQWYFKRYGRASILTYRKNIGGTGYVAKYVTKKIADYDLYVGETAECDLFTKS